jgi:hypothetical protein
MPPLAVSSTAAEQAANAVSMASKRMASHIVKSHIVRCPRGALARISQLYGPRYMGRTSVTSGM